jgi:hypothetical protein
MKKILLILLILGILVQTVSANITQKALIGKWSLDRPQKADPSVIVSFENDSLNLTGDWKLAEVIYYNINYPNYGPDKVDLKYKLKMTLDGEYRLDKNELKKYPKNFTAEIVEGTATVEEVAQASLKEVERLVRDEIRKLKTNLNISSVTETELNLQSTDGSRSFKLTKPRRLPFSQLVSDTVPFFAPDGWHYPNAAKDLADFPKRIKSDQKYLFTQAKGDFNGDGFTDAAAYLLNAEEGRVALFLNMSKSDGSYELGPFGNADRNTVIENGVIIAHPGEYINSVTKAKVRIDNPGFMIVIFDEITNLMYWD